MKILLLEDEIVLGETFKQLLEILGQEVVWVKSKKEVVSLIESGALEDIEVGIFDFYLPDGDFREVYDVLDLNGLLKDFKIVVCSATSVDEDIQFVKSKSLEFLPKPFTLEGLSNKLKLD